MGTKLVYIGSKTCIHLGATLVYIWEPSIWRWSEDSPNILVYQMTLVSQTKQKNKAFWFTFLNVIYIAYELFWCFRRRGRHPKYIKPSLWHKKSANDTSISAYQIQIWHLLSQKRNCVNQVDIFWEDFVTNWCKAFHLQGKYVESCK